MTTSNHETMTCFPVAEADFAEGRIDLASVEVGEEIGRGGMAVIHAGRERAAPFRPLAIKFIHSHLASDPDLVRRFQHEVRAQVGLQDPAIIEMVGWGMDERGRLFMAMEFVDGPTLKDLLLRGHRMPVDLAAHVVRGILQGLSAAHRRGLVHRDVKPANVMITTDGRVKVADFGIAKTVDMTQLTSTGNVIGTPAYMSPEQALARPVDSRSDLFSLGVVLHELLTGTNPFATSNPATTLSRVVHHQQRPVFESVPQVPHALETLVDALLQKDHDTRPADASAVLATLAACIEDERLAASDATLAAWCADPVGVTRRLDGARADRHFEHGQRAYAGGRGSAEAALWEFFLATLLNPAHEKARAWLEQVSQQRGYSLEARATARIQELEEKLKGAPDDLPLVMQLAKLHKAQGNFLQVILYYKRAKALKPPDRYTQSQLETLVGADAAPVIDGTAQIDACDFTLHSARPQRLTVREERERAEGVRDFVGGVLSTAWGKALAVGLLGAGLTAGGAALFDRAAQASVGSPSASGGGRPEGLEDFPDAAAGHVALLDRARELTAAGHHAKAERVLVQLLAQGAEGPLAPVASFLLGESLERQGRRSEALAVHDENVSEHQGEWADRSRVNRGDLLAADGRLEEAQVEYEAALASTTTPEEVAVQARLALADVLEREGRPEAARRELETVQAAAEGPDQQNEARLRLAAAREKSGDASGALALYVEVKGSTDHRGAFFQRATDGIARVESLAGAGGSAGRAGSAGGTSPLDPSAPEVVAPDPALSWEAPREDAAAAPRDLWADEQ